MNSRDAWGNTALHLACFDTCWQRVKGSLLLDIVRVLFDHGADETLRNAAGETPLDIAYKARYHNVPLLDLLLERQCERLMRKNNPEEPVVGTTSKLSKDTSQDEVLQAISVLTTQMQDMEAQLSMKLESTEQLFFTKVDSVKEEVSALKGQVAECISSNNKLRQCIQEKEIATPTIHDAKEQGNCCELKESLDERFESVLQSFQECLSTLKQRVSRIDQTIGRNSSFATPFSSIEFSYSEPLEIPNSLKPPFNMPLEEGCLKFASDQNAPGNYTDDTSHSCNIIDWLDNSTSEKTGEELSDASQVPTSHSCNIIDWLENSTSEKSGEELSDASQVPTEWIDVAALALDLRQKLSENMTALDQSKANHKSSASVVTSNSKNETSGTTEDVIQT